MLSVRLQSVRWFTFALAVAFACSSALAWGPLAHQVVHRAAVEQLTNTEFRDWLRRNADTGARQSMTPDIDWNPFRAESLPAATQQRMAAITGAERSTHYLDADLVLPPAGSRREALRRTSTYAEALQILTDELAKKSKFARLTVDIPSLGSVPWRVAQVWKLLVVALKTKDFERAHLYAAALTHYAADSTMVLHGDSRYDGISALVKGKGLHLSYEMWGFETYLEGKGAIRPKDSLEIWKVPQEIIDSFVSKQPSPRPQSQQEVVAGTLDQIIANEGFIQPLSTAYGTAKGADAAGKAASLYASTISAPNFNGTVQQLAHQRVTDAATFSAALLDSAYEQAVRESDGKKINFPTQPITFSRETAVAMYPPPFPNAAASISLPLSLSNPDFRCPLSLEALGK